MPHSYYNQLKEREEQIAYIYNGQFTLFKVGGFFYKTQKEFLDIFAIRILSLKLTFICIGGNRQSYNQELLTKLQSRVTNKVTIKSYNQELQSKLQSRKNY